MSSKDRLPAVFAQYEHLVDYVRRTGTHRWNSTCPYCGGERHQDNAWPDRCVWYTDQGRPRAYCNQCKRMIWPDQAPGYQPPSPEELEQIRRQHEREAEEEKRRAEEKLAYFRSSAIWEQYHEMLDQQARAWWRGRGIPDSMQDFWQLGWNTRFPVWVDGCETMMTTATIPLFDLGWEIQGVKHRLVAPPDNVGKYRMQPPGNGQAPFIAQPDKDLAGHVYVIEGEIKAAVTFVRLSDARAQMVGIPGKQLSTALAAKLENAERITLIMDPDAKREAWDIAQRLGKQRCRVLIPNMKIDDAILASDMSRHELRYLLNNALPTA